MTHDIHAAIVRRTVAAIHTIDPVREWDGLIWNQDTLHQFYPPWCDVEAQGVAVQIGEFGCYIRTPNEVVFETKILPMTMLTNRM